jgi:hypothetical protein
VTSTTTSTDAVRCSAWARAESLDPIGTVGSYEGYVLVETPLPWPRDVGEVPLLAGLPPRRGYRLQALVPASLEAPAPQRKVVIHRRSADSSFGSFAGFVRYESDQGSSLATTVDHLVSGATPASDVVDVLVCTHGRRDVCCGSKGTDLALQLLALTPRAGVSFHRTSHTGGHRFAPTFLVLPQGTAWAFADVELVDQVLDRSVPFASVASRYRGCAGLDGAEVQAVEREVLRLVGWELLDRPRSGHVTGETASGGGAVVRLEADSDRWEAVVRPGRTLPVPDCMKPLAEAKKTETELVVSSLRAVS